MSEVLAVQWFPGHMTKTRRLMEKNLKLVDLVVEIIDARIPLSSRNPEIETLVGSKPRIVLINKADSADDKVTQQWIAMYRRTGVVAIATDCKSGKGLKALEGAIKEALAHKILQWQAKGMGGRSIRLMIVGVPNVGKSSFINRMAGARKTKVEDRAGVTRGKQWVTLASGMEMLDMPGILWPKFEDPLVGERLAFTGAVKDVILDIEHMAVRLLEVIKDTYYKDICTRYKVSKEEVTTMESYDLLELIALRRGMLMAGGVVNTERAAIMVMDEFRGGLLGRISLEKPAPPVKEAIEEVVVTDTTTEAVIIEEKTEDEIVSETATETIAKEV